VKRERKRRAERERLRERNKWRKKYERGNVGVSKADSIGGVDSRVSRGIASLRAALTRRERMHVFHGAR